MRTALASFFVCSAFCFAAAAEAPLTTATSTPTPPTPTATSTTAARPRVLVLEPTSTVIDPATRGTIANLIIVEVAREKRLDVISAADVKRLAELEGEKQASGCSSSDCLAELAGALGARYVVFGDVGPLGKQYLLNLNLFDSQTASAVNRATVRFAGVEELPDLMPKAVATLIAPLANSSTTTTTPTTTTAANPTPPNPPKPPGEAPSPVLSWGLVGAGGALFAVGVAVDALSPTSSNHRPDGVDFGTVIAMGVGLAAAGTGAVLLVTGGAP